MALITWVRLGNFVVHAMQPHVTILFFLFLLIQSIVERCMLVGFTILLRRKTWQLRISAITNQTAPFPGVIQGLDINPDHITCSAGAGAIIDMLFFCTCSKGDGVLIIAPYYPAFDNDLQVWRLASDVESPSYFY